MTPTLTPAPLTPNAARAAAAPRMASPGVFTAPAPSRMPYAGGFTSLTASRAATSSRARLGTQPWMRRRLCTVASTRRPSASSPATLTRTSLVESLLRPAGVASVDRRTSTADATAEIAEWTLWERDGFDRAVVLLPSAAFSDEITPDEVGAGRPASHTSLGTV